MQAGVSSGLSDILLLQLNGCPCGLLVAVGLLQSLLQCFTICRCIENLEIPRDPLPLR